MEDVFGGVALLEGVLVLRLELPGHCCYLLPLVDLGQRLRQNMYCWLFEHCRRNARFVRVDEFGRGFFIDHELVVLGGHFEPVLEGLESEVLGLYEFALGHPVAQPEQFAHLSIIIIINPGTINNPR